MEKGNSNVNCNNIGIGYMNVIRTKINKVTKEKKKKIKFKNNNNRKRSSVHVALCYI